MGAIFDAFKNAWRDWNTDGVPSSKPYAPIKSVIWGVGQAIEDNTAKLDLSNVDPTAAPRIKSLWIEAVPTLLKTFIGDGMDALHAVYVKLLGNSATTNEVGVGFELENNVPAGGGKQFVVTLFAAVAAGAGSAAAYAANFVTRSNGPPCTVLELNHDSVGVHSGDSPSDNSPYLGSIWTTFLNAFSAGSKRLMAVFMITTPPGYGQLYNRAVAVIGDCVRLYTIEDTTNALACIKMSGTKATGFDMTSAVITSGNAIALPPNTWLNWPVGGTPQQVVGVTGTKLSIGNAVTTTDVGSTFNPALNNTFFLGQAGAAWAGITTQTAPVVVSDPRLKRKIEKLPSMIELVRKVEPRSYQMKIGGYEPETVTVREQVPVLDDNGDPLFDEVEETDEQGNPILLRPLDPRTMKPRTISSGLLGLGRELAPEFVKTKAVPRMAEGDVEKVVYKSRPGRRRHWGFLSTEVKAAFDEIGQDFGGWVKGEDGYEALRYEQLIPVLWKAFQEQDAVVVGLKAQVEDLKQKLGGPSGN